MFTPEEIQARLRERPFRPFRLVASEGLRFTIRHPDLVLALRREVVIGLPTDENSSVGERMTRVAMVHVAALEELEPAPTVRPPVEGNGQV
ncbi:MAG: hypothetical protein K2W96_17860 [Gemmataceae bacterium]|nr:hypothetical protein [Gemmataceae bacterium]